MKPNIRLIFDDKRAAEELCLSFHAPNHHTKEYSEFNGLITVKADEKKREIVAVNIDCRMLSGRDIADLFKRFIVLQKEYVDRIQTNSIHGMQYTKEMELLIEEAQEKIGEEAIEATLQERKAENKKKMGVFYAVVQKLQDNGVTKDTHKTISKIIDLNQNAWQGPFHNTIYYLIKINSDRINMRFKQIINTLFIALDADAKRSEEYIDHLIKIPLDKVVKKIWPFLLSAYHDNRTPFPKTLFDTFHSIYGNIRIKYPDDTTLATLLIDYMGSCLYAMSPEEKIACTAIMAAIEANEEPDILKQHAQQFIVVGPPLDLPEGSEIDLYGFERNLGDLVAEDVPIPIAPNDME